MTTEPTSREVGATKRIIRADVLNRLAALHAEDYATLMTEAYAEHGWTYAQPMTAEEKAAARRAAARIKAQATIDGILAEFPELAG